MPILPSPALPPAPSAPTFTSDADFDRRGSCNGPPLHPARRHYAGLSAGCEAERPLMVKKVPAPKQGDTPGKGTLHAFFSSATPTKRDHELTDKSASATQPSPALPTSDQKNAPTNVQKTPPTNLSNDAMSIDSSGGNGENGRGARVRSCVLSLPAIRAPSFSPTEHGAFVQAVRRSASGYESAKQSRTTS